MKCEVCGEPTTMQSAEGGHTKGHFREEYLCVNGHRGIVEGEAEHSPQRWERKGRVFQG